MEAERMLSKLIYLCQRKSGCTPGRRRKRRADAKESYGRNDREYRGGELGVRSGIKVSVVGHRELRLLLNVLQRPPSTENNIGCFINLIIVPCQTPVTVFTSLLSFVSLIPPHPSPSLSASQLRKSPWLWVHTSSRKWRWTRTHHSVILLPTHGSGVQPQSWNETLNLNTQGRRRWNCLEKIDLCTWETECTPFGLWPNTCSNAVCMHRKGTRV